MDFLTVKAHKVKTIMLSSFVALSYFEFAAIR
jgi:hypothetical protein